MVEISAKISSYRWIVLLTYMLTGINSQIIWITFAPVLPIAEKIYGVSEGDIGLLSAIFSLTFIFLALPSGYYIDSRGFRKAVLIGTAFLSIFGFLRAITNNFLILFIFQTIAGFGQPFIFNSISKLVKGWFPPSEEGLATGLGSLSIYIGIIIGLALTPILTLNVGFYNMLYIYGIISLIILVIFYIFGKESPYRVEEKEYMPLKEFISVLKNRNIILLSLLAFFGVGIFTAYTTWVEAILEGHGLSVETAGELGSLLIIGGVFGSIVIPGLSDKIRKRKIFILISLLVSAALFYVHSLLYNETTLAINLFILGFFFMCSLPLGLELSADSVKKGYAGTANSALWLFGQIGSLILIIAFEGISKIWTWNMTLLLSSIMLLISFILVYFVREKTPTQLNS